MAKLTHKQELFVNAYLGEAKGNATEAARLAGYGGNDVTLASVGMENLRKPQIAALVEKRTSEAAMSAAEVLQKLSEIANRQGADIATRDQIKALELIGRHHKLFTDRIEHKISGDIELQWSDAGTSD